MKQERRLIAPPESIHDCVLSVFPLLMTWLQELKITSMFFKLNIQLWKHRNCC